MLRKKTEDKTTSSKGKTIHKSKDNTKTGKITFISFKVKRTDKEFVLEYSKAMKMIIKLEKSGEKTTDWKLVN